MASAPRMWGSPAYTPGMTQCAYAAHMDANAVLARLGEIFDADERAIAERLIGERTGTIPDRQLIEEIGLAIAIHRRR